MILAVDRPTRLHFAAHRLLRSPAGCQPSRRSPAHVAAMSVQQATPATLDAALSKLENGFVHFKSEWCPDCIRSNDVVRSVVTGAGRDLVVVDVGERADWKTPDAPLRSDPRFRLSGIPTLVHWRGGATAAKLGSELENAASAAAAEKVVREFVAGHT